MGHLPTDLRVTSHSPHCCSNFPSRIKIEIDYLESYKYVVNRPFEHCFLCKVGLHVLECQLQREWNFTMSMDSGYPLCTCPETLFGLCRSARSPPHQVDCPSCIRYPHCHSLPRPCFGSDSETWRPSWQRRKCLRSATVTGLETDSTRRMRS
jgi:hypothetical protein